MAQPIADPLEVPQMIRSLRLAVLVGMLAALVIGTGTALAGHDGKGDGGKGHATKILDTRLVGLAVKGTVVAGVTGAGHAWSLEEGRAKLFSDGRVNLRVEGLVLSPEGTQPVPNGSVIVSCNSGGAGNVVQSGPVPLSAHGDARFNGVLTLPSPCLAPVIFFGSTTGAWFAVSG
jgi:hypothetical protein